MAVLTLEQAQLHYLFDTGIPAAVVLETARRFRLAGFDCRAEVRMNTTTRHGELYATIPLPPDFWDKVQTVEHEFAEYAGRFVVTF